MDSLLTAEEVSQILKTSKNTVCYTLKIPYVKVGGKRMYLKEDLENYIKKNRTSIVEVKLIKRNYVI